MAGRYDPNQPVLGVPRQPPQPRYAPPDQSSAAPFREELARALRQGMQGTQGTQERLPGYPTVPDEEIRRRLLEMGPTPPHVAPPFDPAAEEEKRRMLLEPESY